MSVLLHEHWANDELGCIYIIQCYKIDQSVYKHPLRTTIDFPFFKLHIYGRVKVKTLKAQTPIPLQNIYSKARK